MVGSCSEAAGEEEDELSDEEVALDVGRDEGTIDLDDADAAELEVGLDLPELGDSDDVAAAPVDLDFSEAFGNEDDTTQAGDDEAGPQEFDTSIGIDELGAEDLSDDALGVEGIELNLDDGMAPVATNQGDEEGALETVELFIADESESAAADEPWTMEKRASGDFEVVCSAGTTVFAAGRDTWLQHGDATSRPELDAASSAVLLGGSSTSMLLVSTKLGGLLRIDPSATEPPRTIDWKAQLGKKASSAATLKLCRLDKSQSCLALLSGGALLEVSDSSVLDLAVPVRPRALPAATDAPVVLAESRAGLCLLKKAGGRGAWTTLPLPERVTRVFRDPAVEIATRGEVVALVSRQDGTFVSSDGGQHFKAVAGSAASVAPECGMYEGALRVWVVVSHEVRGESDLLMIDPETAVAVRLARFETEDPREDTFAPVTALRYEPASETLYAVGAFGLFCFTPPARATE